MKKFISIILSILLIVSLYAQTMFIGIQGKVALLPSAKAISFTKEDIQKYFNMDTEELHKEFDSLVEKEGLPTEIIDYVVENNEFKSTLNEFKEDYIEYITGKTEEKPTVPKQKINSIISNSLQKFNKDKNQNVEYKINEELENVINDSISNVTEQVESNETIIKTIGFVFNEKYQRMCIYLSIIIILIIIAINKINSITYLGISFLISGILLLVTYLIKYVSVVKIIEKLIGNLIVNMFNIIFINSILFIVISIVLFIVKYFVNKKIKEKNYEGKCLEKI